MLEADISFDSSRTFILTVLFFISVRSIKKLTLNKKVNYKSLKAFALVIERRNKGYNTFSLSIQQICIFIIQKSLNNL